MPAGAAAVYFYCCLLSSRALFPHPPPPHTFFFSLMPGSTNRHRTHGCGAFPRTCRLFICMLAVTCDVRPSGLPAPPDDALSTWPGGVVPAGGLVHRWWCYAAACTTGAARSRAGQGPELDTRWGSVVWMPDPPKEHPAVGRPFQVERDRVPDREWTPPRAEKQETIHSRECVHGATGLCTS